MDAVLEKILSKTDVEHRLTLPTHSLGAFEFPEDLQFVDFTAVDVYDNKIWKFRLSTRKEGHPKPVIARGWREYVKHKGLKEGDGIILTLNNDERAQFCILAQRSSNNRLFGQTVWYDLLITINQPEYDGVQAQIDDVNDRPQQRQDQALIDVNDDRPYQSEDGWIQKIDTELLFVITNFGMELLSIVFDQLSSVHKLQYARIGMIMSFAAVVLCVMELNYKARKEGFFWRWSNGGIPWLYHPSTNKSFGTFPDIVGLGFAFSQCFVTTINYSFVVRHADNAIKFSLLPIIFVFGLLHSKILENRNRETPNREIP